jgi:hypothetical protein
MQVKTNSAIKVEWSVKNQNAFLKSLQRQVAQLCPLSGKSFAGDMVTVCDDVCWLVAKLTNVANKQDLKIKNFDLTVNPLYRDFIRQVKPETEQDDSEVEDVVLGPGEFYTCAFKMKIDQAPPEYDSSEDLLAVMK